MMPKASLVASTPPAKPLEIAVLAFDQVQLLDVTGPLQVFATANALLEEQGRAPFYAVRVIADGGGLVRSSAGLQFAAEDLPDVSNPVDTLVVAGGGGVQRAAADRTLTGWLAEHAGHTHRVASVCTGAFLLAASGCLHGLRVVTHWRHCERLAQEYPDVQVDPDPIFIRSGRVWTSAGVTAGIDLALALVEEDLGRAIALEAARDLVMFLKRPGGQAQFSAALSLQQTQSEAGGKERFAELHQWVVDHLALDLSVPVLAARAQMSERSFVRHYHAATGVTPARAVERLRVEAARVLLEDGQTSIKRIAARCGFGSEETMRRSFLKLVAVAPQDYRERFSA